MVELNGNDRDFPQYIAITDRPSEGGPSYDALIVAPTRTQLEQTLRQSQQISVDSPITVLPDGVVTNSDGRSAFNLGDFLGEFVSEILSYHSLANLQTTIIGPAQRDILRHRARHTARRDFVEIDNREGYTFYGVPHSGMDRLATLQSRLKQLNDGMSQLPKAVILSLVASFDSKIGDLLRGMLSKHPERLQNSSKQITASHIFSMDSLNHVLDYLIEDEIDGVLRDSHHGMCKYFEDQYKIPIQKGYHNWAEFIEIFERRNLFAHGRSKVTREYQRRCRENGGTDELALIGAELALSRDYLRTSIDTLCEFGVLLIISLWLKTQPIDADEVFGRLNQLCYEMIRVQRVVLARWLLDYALHRQRHKLEDNTHKMMVINLANCYKKVNDIAGMEKAISEINWATSHDRFTICVSALRNDVAAVVNLVPRVIDSGTVGLEGFRDWPVFDGIRSDPRFQDACTAAFGEPVFRVDTLLQR